MEEFDSSSSRVGLLMRSEHVHLRLSSPSLDELLQSLSSCLRWFLGCPSLDLGFPRCGSSGKEYTADGFNSKVKFASY